jgi:hypothetical protein
VRSTKVKKSPKKVAKKKTVKRAEAPAPVRASPPPRATQHASPQRASPPSQAPADLTQDNLERKDWSFVEDGEVLEKELDLARDLIDKALARITKADLEAIAKEELTEDDHALTDLVLRLLDLFNDGEQSAHDWATNKERLSNNAASIIHKLKNYSVLAESNAATHDEEIRALKDEFIRASSSQEHTASIEPLREFLCEAFCLIDIINELNNATPEKAHRGNPGVLSAEKHREREQEYQRSSFPVDTSLQAFNSPAPAHIGVDSQFISPIPNA